MNIMVDSFKQRERASKGFSMEFGIQIGQMNRFGWHDKTILLKL